MTVEDELQKWIITWLRVHPNDSINPTIVIDDMPRSFLPHIEKSDTVFYFMMDMEATARTIQRKYFQDFVLTDEGRLYFRKFIEPIFTISKDKKHYSTIIDQTEGKPETKEQFKKLLDSIKNEIPDKAEKIILKFLAEESVEMIYYLIRLVVTAHTAS